MSRYLHAIFLAFLLLVNVTTASAFVPQGLSMSEQKVSSKNDFAGSPLAATDTAGNIVWKENYGPYGERLVGQTAAADNRQWFHGKAADADTGLQYFGARYYDPVLGRFMGVDPVGFQEDNIHSFNKYAYGNNNPYRYIDPDGRIPVLVYALYVASVRGSIWLAQRQAGAIMAAEVAAGAATGAATGGISAAEGLAARGAGKLAKEGIYEFKQGAQTYCGQSCDIPRRLNEHMASGKLTPDMLSTLKTTEVLGGQTARELAEHRRIQQITGGIPARFSDKVSNKVDPIGQNRSHLLNE